MRETSIEAYNTIKQNGLLSRRRMEVYDVVFNHGPLTAGEIGQKMSDYRSSVSTADRNIHARLSELKKMKVIKEIGTQLCSVTNMTVIVWSITGTLPESLPKIKTTKQQLNTAIKFIEEQGLMNLYKRLYEET